jgi:endoglucanase
MRTSLCWIWCVLAGAVNAQDLLVYDDALQNAFVDGYSYGGGTDLLHATTTHNGSAFAIAFTGDSSNAVAFPNETLNFTTADYAGVRFYVHGGASGGQQLRLQLYNNLGGVPLANVELDSYIAGAAIVANDWRLVSVRFADAPLAFVGTFDRFDLQSDAAGTQPTLYIDDVSLIAATALADVIFSDNFEATGAPSPGQLRFSAASYSVDETAGSVTISVQRVGGSSGAVSADYATSDLTATAPGDYTPTSGTLLWADGDTSSKSFAVPVVNDGLAEANETLGLALSNPVAATLGNPATAVLTIVAPPSQFRGSNVVGMEMFYNSYDQAAGPVGGTHYPVHDTRLIDYFASKGMTTIRFLFSWEAMQSTLMGPVPAANAGNYQLYFDRYKNIVDYATNVKGMQVIVEPWQANAGGGAGGARWRGDLVGSAAVPISAWSDFWTKFAAVYAANPRVSFGLVNEPNSMSTMSWWAIAQAGITAIRNAGATQRIFVPGNGYSAASSWTSNFYDTAAPQRSNAYGWLNANGPGLPISDPLNNIVVEVHTYLDADEGGGSTQITSITAAREHLTVVVDEARAQGYQVYLGELGFLASVPIAAATWADFIAYFEANPDVLVGFTWWAGGAPGWWDDIGASGGGHFSITPTSGATFTGDTINMDMIENSF